MPMICKNVLNGLILKKYLWQLNSRYVIENLRFHKGFGPIVYYVVLLLGLAGSLRGLSLQSVKVP